MPKAECGQWRRDRLQVPFRSRMENRVSAAAHAASVAREFKARSLYMPNAECRMPNAECRMTNAEGRMRSMATRSTSGAVQVADARIEEVQTISKAGAHRASERSEST